MSTLFYRITLQEPTIVTALEGEPNSAVSFSYLPGSTLRGMVIGAYMRHHVLEAIDAADSTIRRLFFTPATRYLNGYLVEPVTNQRALPAPLTWSRPKAANYPIYDSLYKEQKTDEEQKAVKDFWVVDGGYAYSAKPKRVLNVHNARNRQSGRPLGPTPNNPDDQDRGTVFRYDALASGQVFEAAILCDHADDAYLIAEVLQNTEHTLLGGAVSAGYGRVSLHHIEIIDGAWLEAPRYKSDRLIITLLSDVILRDANGQYCMTSEGLCIALRPFLGNSIAIAEGRAYLGTTMHGGFNRKWGLPLPQMPALTMGSVIEVKPDSHHEGDLANLMRYGLGERRNEGFGRVTINWQPFAPLSKPPSPPPNKPVPPDLSGVSLTLWERTQQRIIQKSVENDVLRITYRKRYTIEGPVTRTQLMRLRAVIKNELRNSNPSPDCFRKFFESIKGKVADQQFSQTKIGGNDLRAWLLNPQFKELGTTGVSVMIQLALIDAVLERAIKTRTQIQQEATRG